MTRILTARRRLDGLSTSESFPWRPQALFDRGRREFWTYAALSLLLVLLRCAAFTFWEETYFNSDEAIIGLMAKHLSEFKTFPLFFYGQNYMLGVQSWLVAPVFWIARPSVVAMRLPLVLLNGGAAVVMMRGLIREVGLRPGVAFVALLPFIIPSPIVAGSLIDGNGCGAGELFLYVAALWMLRGRPAAFGALLAVAYLHREFILAVVPALLIVGLLARSVWSLSAVRNALRAAVGFALVWLVIDDLRLHFFGASLVLQAQQLIGGKLCFTPAEMPQRLRYVITDCLPFLLGGRREYLPDLGVGIVASAGSPIAGSFVLAALVAMVGRSAWNWRRIGRPAGYAVYLLVAGLAMLGAYSLAWNLNIKLAPLVRYLHLALLVPTAVFAIFMHREPTAACRRVAIVVFLVAGTVNVVDTSAVLHAAYSRAQPSYHRQLADLLMQHRVRYARADYWDAYMVDFFTREKIIVGSNGKVRIPEYEAAVDAHPEAAATIARFPCDGEIRQFPWCISLPQRSDKR